MNFQGSNVNPMGFDTSDHSCGCGCVTPTYQQCNQVVQTCNVQEVPHYINYHTHVVNNVVKRHINIPTYSTSSENVFLDEYVQGQPIYQQPVFQQPTYPQPGFNQPLQQGVMNQPGYQGMVNPMNPTPFGF